MPTEKIRVKYPVICEGKYDKNTLSSVIDAKIITTGGFSVFNNSELRSLIRRLGEKGKVILLTDSDGGGVQIRSFIRGLIPKENIINLYIPKIKGKEKRKKTAGKSGLLGVEGMDAQTLRRLFSSEGLDSDETKETKPVTKMHFYEDGLSGGNDSAKFRRLLAEYYSLPSEMSANAMLDAINIISDYDEYRAAIDKIKAE